MKKFLAINKLLSFSLLSLVPIVASSCGTSSVKNSVDSNEQASTSLSRESIASFDGLLNYVFNNNQVAVENFKNSQDQIFPAKFNEVKQALVWAPPFYVNVLEQNSELKKQTSDSINILKDTFKNDWYWMVKNISKFTYQFNPYGQLYDDESAQKQDFDLIEHLYGRLDKKINWNEIFYILSYKIQVDPDANETFKDLTAHFYFLDDGFVKFYTYENQGKQNLFFVPDYFKIALSDDDIALVDLTANQENSNGNTTTKNYKAISLKKEADQEKYKNIALDFENKIWEKWTQKIDSLIEEAKEFGSKTEEEVRKENTYEKFFQYFSNVSYVGMQFKAINELNASNPKTKLFKYTLRWIDEN